MKKYKTYLEAYKAEGRNAKGPYLEDVEYNKRNSTDSETILFVNNYCKIVQKDTFYIVRSNANKYNDQYFFTLDEAKKSIGAI